MNEKMEKLFKLAKNDQELAKKLFECESAMEVKELAAEVNIELTVAEVKESGQAIVDELEKEFGDGELSEDNLDNVAGGFAVATAAAGVMLVTGAVETYIKVDNEIEEETGKDIDDHVKDGFNTAVDTISGWF